MHDFASPSRPRTWFITGASSGLGRALAIAAADHGDQVLATARRAESLAELTDRFPRHIIAARLDVTVPTTIRAAVDLAVRRTGRIDIVVNNAGYSVLGALEELSDEQVRAQFDTNFFGVVNVSRAVLPVLRAQRSGHLLQMSSISGAQPWTGFSMYVASKHAVEGFSSSLATEVSPLGIAVTIVEPGPFRTDFFARLIRSAPLEDYAETVGATRAFLETFTPPGDPRGAADAILAVAGTPNPPLRLALGDYAFDEFRAEYRSRLAELERWETLSRGADSPRALKR